MNKITQTHHFKLYIHQFYANFGDCIHQYYIYFGDYIHQYYTFISFLVFLKINFHFLLKVQKHCVNLSYGIQRS